MILRNYIFRRVTIVGVGLMGGSLGLALKKHKLAKEIVGLSQRQSTLVQAIKYKAIDTGETDIRKALRNTDLVVLATPVDSIIKLMSLINPHLKRGCIITDLGSAKVEIIDASVKILNAPDFYVGSHPLVGSNKTGVENAHAELFENQACIMTPTASTNQSARKKVKLMWQKIGADVKNLSAEEHDEILAGISHLPHLLAFVLMEVVAEDNLSYATKSFKDFTRIASSSPQMWSDICLANSKNVLRSLDDMVKHLAFLRKAIVNRDANSIVHSFTKSKEKRDSLKND